MSTPHYQARDRKNSIMRKYGLSLIEYEDMLNRQGWLCAICHNPADRKAVHPLEIDHDHTTREVRGLLCHYCNIGIGFLERPFEWAKKANDYLGQYDCQRSSPEMFPTEDNLPESVPPIWVELTGPDRASPSLMDDAIEIELTDLPIKECSCGKTFTRKEWEALHIPNQGRGNWADLGLDGRDCPRCESTLCIPTRDL